MRKGRKGNTQSNEEVTSGQTLHRRRGQHGLRCAAVTDKPQFSGLTTQGQFLSRHPGPLWGAAVNFHIVLALDPPARCRRDTPCSTGWLCLSLEASHFSLARASHRQS